MRSIRRGGYRFQDRVVNPNEKPIQACGWAVQAFTRPGISILGEICDFFVIVGGVVLSVCSGSGSMLEACMQLGRSCLAIDNDGLIFKSYIIILLSFRLPV